MPSNTGYERQTYNSFSGVDIRASFGDQIIGEIQAISYSVTREKAPIYTMGDPNPRSFSRGKRGIAGSLIFIMFDTNALLDAFKDKDNYRFYDWPNSVKPPRTEGQLLGGTSLTSSQLALINNQKASDATVAKELTNPYFTDQIPPFDITLTGENEYGAVTSMKIWGVELLNEGSGVSVDDMVIEQQYTFVARNISQWTKGTARVA